MKKPNLFDFQSAEVYLDAKLSYLKVEHPGFSIRQACTGIEGLSPTLVTQVRKGYRRLTKYRAREFAELLRLTASEKAYWLQLVARKNQPGPEDSPEGQTSTSKRQPKRKQVSTNILRDWVSVYVKDAILLSKNKPDFLELSKILGGVASENRIKKSFNFLAREGHLRRTQDGTFVEDTPITVATTEDASLLIKKFHKASLKIASQGVENFSPSERFANGMVIALDEKGYIDLLDIIAKFSEELQSFAEGYSGKPNRLYQVLVHLTPTGGRTDNSPETK